MWRAGARKELGAAFLASYGTAEGAYGFRRAHPHPTTLRGTSLFCTRGECVCVSDRVKVCACVCLVVQEPRSGR